VPLRRVVIGKREGQWAFVGEDDATLFKGKRPGLQGPIDDAFTTSFLCVRGTGKPWSRKVNAWADASLNRFAYEWHRYFRGELPVKDDTAVTEDDLRRCNLILFGDPGSNRLLERALPSLPLRWTPTGLQMGGGEYDSNHVPILILPNPLAKGRYLVL